MSSAQDEQTVLLKLLIDGLPDHAVYLLDTKGHVLSWNAGAQAIKGYSADEIMGRHFSCFYPPSDVAAGAPAFGLRTALESGRYVERGVRIRKDGSSFHAEVTLVSIFDAERRHVGFGKLTRDITAQEQAWAAELRLRRFLRVVVETMTDGLIVTDAHGRVRMVNGACERIFGHAAAAMVDEPIAMVIPEASGAAGDNPLVAWSDHGAPREVLGARKDGDSVAIGLAVGSAALDGEKIRVCVVHDLTERHAIEANLRQSQRLDAIGQLTGGVAHDFNNLLMVIMASAESLAEGVDGDERREAVDRILSATVRGADLTRRLLAFSRKQSLAPQISDVNELVTGVGKMLSRTLGPDISFNTVLCRDVWPTNVDRLQLESAVVNLCLNARDAMPGGGQLTVETTNVALNEEALRAGPGLAAGDYVSLAVRDTGTGIEKEHLDRVFEPFFTTKEVGKGTGLGLSMVYGFALQSGGHITVDSAPGQGTTVRLYLPRTVDGAVAVDTCGETGLPVGSERILLVDDDPSVLRAVAGQLRELGYEVDEASRGEDALQRLAQDSTYALLLSDLVMPGPLNGRELAQAARLRRPELPVLLISGHVPEVTRLCEEVDSRIGLLDKPFRKSDLARAVRATLDAVS